MPTLISNGSSVPHASNHEDFMDRLVQFVTGCSRSAFTGTGGVRLRYARALSTAVDETWTLVCTNAGAGTFSVTGSVSGAQASATVGTPYNNGKVAFTLGNVSGAAVLSDQITFTTKTNGLVSAGNAWELIAWKIPAADTIDVYLRGLGNAGADQIYVNLRAYKDTVGDYYNMGIRGATGYLESAATYADQPGTSASVHICMLNGVMPYWFIANGRRFMVAVKVSTVYETCYAGFFFPTGTPSEYAYPLAIGGSHSVSNRRWSDNQTNAANGMYHRAFWNPAGALKVRNKGGAWMDFANYDYISAENASASGAVINCTAPFRDVVISRTIAGGYVLYPVTMHASSPSIDLMGDLDGVYMISGASNVSENIAQVDGVDHLVVQNTYRTNIGEYAAFKLE